MRLPRLKSIGSEFTIVVSALVLVAVATMVVFVTKAGYDILKEMHFREMRQSNAVASRALDDFLERYGNVAEVLSRNHTVINSVYSADEDAKQRMRGQIELQPAIVAIAAFNTTGEIVTGTDGDGNAPAVPEGVMEEFRKALIDDGEASHFSFSPFLAPSGKLLFGIAYPVRDFIDNRLIGGVVTFVDFHAFSSDYIAPIKIGDTGYAYMVDAEGTIIAHPDPKVLMKPSSVKDKLLGSHGDGKDWFEYDYHGHRKIQIFSRNEQTGWYINITVYEDDLTGVAQRLRDLILLIGAGTILVLIVAVAIGFRRFITNPVARLVAYANDLAAGRFDSTLDGNFRYELGTLADDLRTANSEIKKKFGFANGILKGMNLPCIVADRHHKITYLNQELLTLFRKSGTPEDWVGRHPSEFFLGDTSRTSRLMQSFEDNEACREERTFHLDDGSTAQLNCSRTPIYDLDGNKIAVFGIYFDMTEIRANEAHIQEQNTKIADAAERAHQISERLASASEQLSAQIDESLRGSETQRDRAAETATAIEQMNATVLEVARNASNAAENASNASDKSREGAQSVTRTIDAINSVRDQAQELKENMTVLGEQAQDIGRVMNVINDIADQTNLLALNAAIEAARAGDAGRGFAVVADEVRKLAEKTMEATKEVGAAITAIQQGAEAAANSTDSAVTAVNEGDELAKSSGLVLEEILRTIEGTAAEVASIATAAEEQSATSEQISRATQEVNRISMETAEAMNQSTTAVEELVHLAQNLKQIINNMQG